MADNEQNKPKSRNLYVFQDHYKSSNDFFRNETGKYFDFDGQKMSNESIIPKLLWKNSSFFVTNPILVDENKAEYIQTAIFKPDSTQEVNTLLFAEEYKYGKNLNQLLVNFLSGKVLWYTDPAILANQQQEEQEEEPTLREEAAQELLDALDERNRQPVESAQEANRASEQIRESQAQNSSGNTEIVDQDIFGDIEDINFETIRPVDFYKNKNAIQYAKLEPVYNAYVERYEQLLPLIPEEALPNFYAYSLVNDKSLLSEINQSNFDSSQLTGELSPYEEVVKKFDKLISLEGNVSLGRGRAEGTSTVFDILSYYEQYAKNYDKVSVDYVDTAKERFKTFVNDISDTSIFQKILEYKHQFPMYSNIEFYSPTESPFANFLKDANISLSSFQDFINNKVLVDSSFNSDIASYVTMAEILQTVGEVSTEKKELIEDLFSIDFDIWFNKFLNEYNTFGETQQQQQEILSNVPSVPSQVQSDVTGIAGSSSTPISFINYQGIPVETSEAISQIDFIESLAAQVKYNELISENIRSYSDIMSGKYAKIEILLFKIVKRDAQNNIIQTFFVMNVPDLEIENFIDTQVKYGKDYFYEIYAWNLVYGTKYKYIKLYQQNQEIDFDSGAIATPISSNSAEESGLISIWSSPDAPTTESPSEDVADENKLYNNGVFAFVVKYSPKIKIVETLYFENRRVKILDKPPTAPSVSLYEYINNPTFSVALQTSAGKYSEFPVYILPTDEDYFETQKIIQESSDGQIVFKDEGGVKQIQVFKTGNQPYFYSDFSLYKTLDYPNQSAFDEINEFDKTFYYCFRCIDVHGNISNPTPIYTVKTIEDNGFFYQEFGTYEFPPINTYLDFIEFKKYLKISPSLLQKIYNYSENRLGLLDTSVFDRQFMVKLTSKHSGKCARVFFKFNNKRNET
jgi:hypothetical protein